MRLQRYTLNIGPGEPGMVENVYGAWVQYEDAVEQREQLLKLAAGFMDPLNHSLFCDAVQALATRTWGGKSAGVCGRCYDESEVFPANCAEKPELLAGAPLGQYHCPDCGAMVLAGVPHPPLCRMCIERRHPGFDLPRSVPTP